MAAVARLAVVVFATLVRDGEGAFLHTLAWASLKPPKRATLADASGTIPVDTAVGADVAADAVVSCAVTSDTATWRVL